MIVTPNNTCATTAVGSRFRVVAQEDSILTTPPYVNAFHRGVGGAVEQRHPLAASYCRIATVYLEVTYAYLRLVFDFDGPRDREARIGHEDCTVPRTSQCSVTLRQNFRD